MEMARGNKNEPYSAFTPSYSLIAKVGSILVHVEEATGDDGHEFDWATIRQLLADREVQEWLDGLRRHALVPVQRKQP